MKYVITNPGSKSSVLSYCYGIKELEDFRSALDPDNPECLYNKDDQFAILISNRECYDFLVDLDQRNKIHFGLRNYNYKVVYELSILTIKNCRLCFLNDGYIGHEAEEKIKFFIDYDEYNVRKFELDNKYIVTLDEGIDTLRKFANKEDMGFDFESYGLPEEWDFDPVGIGISNNHSATYIDFRYYSSDAVKDSFMKEFNDWCHEYYKFLWCYYASFEVNALRVMFNDFLPLNDCLALIRCDYRVGTLKLNAQHYLNIEAWDTEQDELNDDLWTIFSNNDSYDIFKSKYNEIVERFSTNPDNKLDADLKIYNAYERLKKFNLDEKMLHKYWGGPFAVTPMDVTGKYCCYDAYYTLQIRNVIQEKFHYIGECDINGR